MKATLGSFVAGAMVLVSAAGWMAPTASPQTPARDARVIAPPPSGTASVSGVVTTADAGARPLRMAHVVIIGASTGALRVTSTDSDGRFTFAGLPADRYIVGASRPPFLGAVAGARRPARPGTAIAVAEGAQVANVAIRLPLGGVITGTITDERGQPATGVLVGLQQLRLQNGERVLATTSIGPTWTDDRGRYRIHGLPPGEYFLSVLDTGRGRGAQASALPLLDADVDAALRGGRTSPPPASASTSYAPVYFPGTTRAADAAPIAVGAGDERSGVDFQLQLARISRVEGMVLGADGQPAPSSQVLLVSSTSNAMQMTQRARVLPDGRFSFQNQTPGSYTLMAVATGALAGQSTAMKVEIDGTDLTGVQLMLGAPLTLGARLVFDGAAGQPALAGRRVPLKSLTSGLPDAAAPQVSPARADGTFEITRVSPGRYLIGGPMFFGATNDSVTWALESVVVDGRDVTDRPFEVANDAPPKSIVVTYSDRWQQIAGRLSQASGAAASDYTIVVFPADRQYWLSGSRRIVTTRPGVDGRYAIAGPGPLTIPAGDYLLAAVTDLDKDEQFDPAFLSSLMPLAIPVKLGPGERKVQDLVIK